MKNKNNLTVIKAFFNDCMLFKSRELEYVLLGICSWFTIALIISIAGLIIYYIN